MITTDARCPHCNASMKAYWYTMSKKYVLVLLKMLKRAREKHENHVFINETGFSNVQYASVSKLRYFGLVAKYKDEDGHKKEGWLITRLGGQFLSGKARLPKKVKVFRNHVEEKTTETVDIHEVMAGNQDWPRVFEYEIMRKSEDA